MNSFLIPCFVCRNPVMRSKRRVNESNKNKWKTYCSSKCLSKAKNKKKTLVCDNPECNKSFERAPNQVSSHNYCSRICSAIVNNSKYPKKGRAKVKTCLNCGKNYTGEAIKYCSTDCQYEGSRIKKDKLVKLICNFYDDNGRIPTKKEFPHYRAIRSRFGTWNKAIKSAGFEPNPVMFAKKHIANDGHKCDSLAEKIIDDWLFARDIEHEINFPYPGDLGLTVDFKIKDFWIEFFGLSGEHKRYDQLKDEKLKISRQLNLDLIEIYPRHLFPKNKLDIKLAMFL